MEYRESTTLYALQRKLAYKILEYNTILHNEEKEKDWYRREKVKEYREIYIDILLDSVLLEMGDVTPDIQDSQYIEDMSGLPEV